MLWHITWFLAPCFSFIFILGFLIKLWAKVARKELLAIVRNRIKNSHMRLDPTYENYVKVLDIFVGKAKGNPLKNYLQI